MPCQPVQSSFVTIKSFAVLVPEVRLQRVDRVRAEVDEERPRLRILLEESKEAKTKRAMENSIELDQLEPTK